MFLSWSLIPFPGGGGGGGGGSPSSDSLTRSQQGQRCVEGKRSTSVRKVEDDDIKGLISYGFCSIQLRPIHLHGHKKATRRPQEGHKKATRRPQEGHMVG